MRACCTKKISFNGARNQFRNSSTDKAPEFEEVVRLQREIWGFDNVELLPFRLFVVADKIGGQLLGAFDRDQMVGFCVCIPGLKPGGKFYLHSHMLGVLSAYRNTGVGRQLKWKQRDYALERGIDLIEWTFDPLEIKNAFFNISGWAQPLAVTPITSTEPLAAIFTAGCLPIG